LPLHAYVPTPEVNEISDRARWEEMREACLRDPAAFHGALAKRTVCWFLPDEGDTGVWAWWDSAAGRWRGWDATTGAERALDLPEAFEPWEQAFDPSDAPRWRSSWAA
jgi:acrylyl-CoA reductase (NADPH)/3-hydroxypropionyl-CoA dehydratase/3-hydroxypropionyl-CoA synthetase